MGTSHPLGAGWSRVWINGRELPKGAVVALAPGLHRILVEVQGTLACPSFAPVDAGFLRAEAKRHAQELRAWHAARQRHGESRRVSAAGRIAHRAR